MVVPNADVGAVLPKALPNAPPVLVFVEEPKALVPPVLLVDPNAPVPPPPNADVPAAGVDPNAPKPPVAGLFWPKMPPLVFAGLVEPNADVPKPPVPAFAADPNMGLA